MAIHPTAIIDKRAEIDSTAEIGPYAIIEGEVHVGANTRVYPHAYLTGWTEIGPNCSIHPGAVVGHEPQDLKYKGEKSYCRIGQGTVIRESVSIHRGTEPGSVTEVGAECFLMANSHIGHNCRVDENVILANGALLAGHVTVGKGAFLSGNSGAHQFVRIGELAMIGGLAVVTTDLPPCFMAVERDRCVGINLVGMRRAGFNAAERKEIKHAYRTLYRSGLPFLQVVERLAAELVTEPGKRLVEFLQAPSKRSIISSQRDAGFQKNG